MTEIGSAVTAHAVGDPVAVGNIVDSCGTCTTCLAGRRTSAASSTAGLLAFAAEHGIGADVEVLPSSRVEEALERLDRGDVRYRFVLDMSDLDD